MERDFLPSGASHQVISAVVYYGEQLWNFEAEKSSFMNAYYEK